MQDLRRVVLSDAPLEPEERAGQKATATILRVRNVLTGLAAVITAVLGVLFLLVPSLKPLPRDKISASVEVVDIEPSMSIQRWVGLQFPAHPERTLKRLLGDVPAAELNSLKVANGTVIYAKLQTDGFKHRSVKLRAELYNANTRTPSKNNGNEVLFPESGRLNVDAPSRASIQLIITQRTRYLEGTLFFRVFAYDGSGILAYADSKPFKDGKLVTP